MSDKPPIAFMSYVRADDEHDGGRISTIRARLEGEVRIQTGKNFPIFQDRNDLVWGDQWKSRIKSAIMDSTFLIPVVTPSYFKSYMCRSEFDDFLIRERTLGQNDLILPIYYLDCLEMSDAHPDEIGKVLRDRNYSDLRKYRFTPLDSPELQYQIAEQARAIVKNIARVTDALAIAKTKVAEALVDEPISPASPDKKLLRASKPGARKPRRISRASRLEQPASKWTEVHPYSAYTKEFDEVIRPTEITDIEEISKLQSTLNRIVRSKIKENKHIVSELKNVIQGSQKQSLTVLLDNSGSMRGEPAATAISWTSIVADLMSGSEVELEVLGFTTRAWKGGLSRELWLGRGKPEYPGRLNDLRHLIYKSYDETYIESLPNFGLMMREGLLKENIDGESILWAKSRIEKRILPKKSILVMSDGAPVDDSTLSVNEPGILDRHLKQVVSEINSDGRVRLWGVGLGHDVSRYYGEMSESISTGDFAQGFVNCIQKVLA